MKTSVLALLAFVFVGFGAAATPAEQACIAKQTTIENKLGCLQGVTFAEAASPIPGYRKFDIQFIQPIDHANAGGGTFSQSLILLHVDENEPMVLETSGYNIFGVYPTNLTRTFGTNQIQVEHRYFAGSTPMPPVDWSKLNIKQSADDFHAVVLAFKQIYAKKWVNTGASKGGMTSLFHKRFYPDDLDGTVANVAPLSFSPLDQRYVPFLETVGGDAYKACRADFMALQRLLLQNRSQLVPRMTGVFTTAGGADAAFETAVSDAYFQFWQYNDPAGARLGCSSIPRNGSVDDAFNFLKAVGDPEGLQDESLGEFLAYFYQAATQLGSPEDLTSHIQDLMLHPIYNPEIGNLSYSFSNAAMVDMDHWARTSADKIIYVYGEFDPWSAGAYPVSEAGKETFKYIQPGGNHGSNYEGLPKPQRDEAIAVLSRWIGKAPVATFMPSRQGSGVWLPSLEEVELRARRHLHLL